MLAYLFVVLGIIVHVVGPGVTFGFTPLGASLLFFGANRSRKEFLFLLPVLAAADVFLNSKYGYAFHADQMITLAWYVGACFLGSLLKDRIKPLYVIGASLALSVSFFLLSNFAVWATWNMYPKTFSGLTACYVAGLPFFQKGIASDFIFSVMFFGVPLLAPRLSGAESHRRQAL